MRLVHTTFDPHGDELATRRGWIDDFVPDVSDYDGDPLELE